ncbi:MAG: hypothetical protein OEW19_03620, partial [Acidobacteriota bacterium]|nr:hypothetical protein [Acidobacteriota bacterium]
MSSHLFRRCRAFVALFTALSLPACSTWSTQSRPPQEIVLSQQPDQVRLSLADGSRLIVYHPAIDGDRLVAWTRSDRSGSPDASIPLAEIRSVEVHKISPGRTVAAVVAVGVGVTLLVILTALPRTDSGPTATDTRFSCPFIYSDTGAGWRLDSGTFGGAITRSLRRTDVDNLDFARPRDGVL